MKTKQLEKKDNKILDLVKSEYKRFLVIVISSVIYSLGLIWFLQPGALYSGGVVGLMQLVVDIIAKITGETYAIGMFIFIINVPILIVAFKYVSLKFALYSLLSIIIQTIMGLGFVAVIDFGINNSQDPTVYNQLMLAIIGGGLVGFGGALALRYGGSTGGIDIFAQALALKKNFSIGLSSLIFNCIIALVGGFVLKSWPVVFYTIIRIVITSSVTDKIHTIYNFLKVEIITDKGVEISEMIMKVSGRGVTMLNGEGAYTHKKKYVLETVLSSFEYYKIKEEAKSIDEHVFIISSPVKNILGNFKKRTIA